MNSRLFVIETLTDPKPKSLRSVVSKRRIQPNKLKNLENQKIWGLQKKST
jgi:hypothetical protein